MVFLFWVNSKKRTIFAGREGKMVFLPGYFSANTAIAISQ